MEEYYQHRTIIEKVKDAGKSTYQVLGSLISTAPDYKPQDTGSSRINTGSQGAASTRKKRQSHNPVIDDRTTAGSSYVNSSSSRAASGQTPSADRPSIPSRNSHDGEGVSPTNHSDRKHRPPAAIASVPEGLRKLSTDYANTLLKSQKRSTASGREDPVPHQGPEDKSKTASNKRRKVDNMPPASIADSAKPLKTRDQRDQEAMAQSLARAADKRSLASSAKYGKNAKNVNGRRDPIEVKGKGKAVQADEPEIIELDADSDEEAANPPQQNVSLAAMMKSAAAPSKESVNLKSAQKQSSNNVIAPASPIPLASLHLEDHASPLPRQAYLPPMEEGMSRSAESNHREAPAGEGMAEGRARRRDVTPPNTSPTTRLTMLAAGRASESHIAYAQRLSPQPKSLPSQSLPPPPKLRSPSPCMFQGDGRVVSRPIRERPAWVDNPPYADEGDVALLRQIPLSLVSNFVALADDMDRRGEDQQTFRLEEFLEFRGWKNQIIGTTPDSNGAVLDARHVWAAQKCCRAKRSANIREAEARGMVFWPSGDSSATHEDASEMPEEMVNGLTNDKAVARIDPSTPNRRPVTIAQDSPEFSVQPTPPKRKVNVDRIESPGPSAVRHQQHQQLDQKKDETHHQNQQGDEIQSPQPVKADNSPEDPIEEDDERDEIQWIRETTKA
ncbi:hypothetical protein QFC21_003854 [Naganishia friedmannii]|uniref:Uncharacterized protein n=1 Tax=Naganishia friedmannii TaxID=89922 RepID=A0ACC2VMK3_9TREE|nr:hypothetical protein QFC21_003854 [Naganishia friedmannii]